MKLKYKKAVLTISMGTMFIGLMAFSIGAGSSKTAKTAKKAEPVKAPVVQETQAPEDYTLSKSTDERINELIQSYFKASVARDMDTLEEIITNIEYVSEEQLKVKYQYVEDVKNIESYVVDGPTEGSYLVYVYSELKIKDIKTLAPGLSRFYIITGDDGKLKVFFGANSEIEAFIEKADNSEEVLELAAKVQTRLEEALSSDKELMEFNKKLTEKAETEEKEAGEEKKTEKEKSSAKDKKKAENKKKVESKKKAENKK